MYFLKGFAVLFALIISEIDVHAQVRVSGLSALEGASIEVLLPVLA